MAAGAPIGGARAKFGFYGPNETVKYVGLFTNVSWGVVYDVAPAYVLGRYSAAALEYTAMETVDIRASGWRVMDHGPYSSDGAFPALSKLLTHQYLTMQVYDRQTGGIIARIKNVRPTSWSSSVDAKQLSSMSFSFVGMMVQDESDESEISNQETSTATHALDGDINF